jgi:PEGA domain
MKTKLAVVGLLVLGMVGCSANATHQNASAVEALPLTQKISIISDPPGAHIDINNNYVGDAPIEADWYPHWLMGSHDPLVITATPREAGYVQRKEFGPFDPAPDRVRFQMNLQPQ